MRHTIDPQVSRMTAEQCGASPAGLNAARAILSLDGLAPFRASLSPDYDQCAVVAEWARIIDREQRIADAQATIARLRFIASPAPFGRPLNADEWEDLHAAERVLSAAGLLETATYNED